MTKRLPRCYAVIASLNTFNSMQQQEAGATGDRQDSRNTVPSNPNDKHNTKFVPVGRNVPSSVQNQMQVGATPSSTRRVFPDNVRPLNSAVEDSAAPVFPGKDLPVFPPEQGPRLHTHHGARQHLRDSCLGRARGDDTHHVQLANGKYKPRSYSFFFTRLTVFITSNKIAQDRVSVYSGPLRRFTQTGLTAERCYVFQVAAYVDGRWTRFSKPKETSSLTHDVEVEKLDEKLSELRNQMESTHLQSSRVARACWSL